jgi:hypothetical protein
MSNLCLCNATAFVGPVSLCRLGGGICSLFIWWPEAEKRHKEKQQRLTNRPESSSIVQRERGANYVIDVFVPGPAVYDGRAVFVTIMFCLMHF